MTYWRYETLLLSKGMDDGYHLGLQLVLEVYEMSDAHHKLLEQTSAFVALQKEEHVLAQEAVLDALLRCEEQNNQWPPWDREDQLSVVRQESADQIRDVYSMVLSLT